MPRLAPQMNGTPCVMEHRLTLGTYERRQLAEAVDSYRRDKWLENIPNLAVPIAAVAVPLAVGVTGYTLAMGAATALGVGNKFQEMINWALLNPLSGKSRDGMTGYRVWLAKDGSMLEVPHYAQIFGVGWIYSQYLNIRGYPSLGQAAKHRPPSNGRTTGGQDMTQEAGYTEPDPDDPYWQAQEEAGTGGGGGRRGGS